MATFTTATATGATEGGGEGGGATRAGSGTDVGAPNAGRLLDWVDRYRFPLFAAVALVYLAGFNGVWRVSKDSALFMALGRSIARGEGFTYLGEPHNWVEPGLPYLIGWSFRLFGEDVYWPILLAILLSGAAALGATFGTVRLYAGRPTAVLVTLLLALWETFYRYAYHVFTDMPFLMAVMMFLLGYELLVGPRPPPAAPAARRARLSRGAAGWLLILAAAPLLCVFRPAVLTFLGALAAATAWKLYRGPYRLRHLLILLVAASVFIGFRQADPRRRTADQPVYREARLKGLVTERLGFAVRRTLTDNLPALVSEHLPEAVFTTEIGPVADEVASVAVMAAGVLLLRRRALWGLWVGATLAQMMFWLPRERYFLPILPLLILGLWEALVWLDRAVPGRRGALVFWPLLLALAVANTVGVGWFIAQQRARPLPGNLRDDNEVRGVLEMASLIRTHAGDGDVVIADAARMLHYFSGEMVVAPLRTVLPPTPREQRFVEDKLRRYRAFLAVLSNNAREDHEVTDLVARLGLRRGELLGTAERGEWRGRVQTPLRLYRLVPGGPADSRPSASAQPAASRPSATEDAPAGAPSGAP